VVLGRGVRLAADLVGLPAVSPTEAAAGGFERLLVIGSLAEVAALAASCPGTAVAFAGRHELSALFALPEDPAAARHRLDQGTPYRADLGTLHLGNTTVPFLGHVVAGAAGMFRRGPTRPGRSGDVRVVGERTLEVAGARTVVVSNVQRLGISVVAPRAAINDGRLDLTVLSGRTLDLIRLRPALRHGLHERSPLVRRTTTDGCQVQVPDRWPVRADGRVIGRGGFGVTIDPGAVTLLV